MTFAKPFTRFYGRLSEGHTAESLWEAEAPGRRQGALAGPQGPVRSPRLKQHKRGARWDVRTRSRGPGPASKARGSSRPHVPTPPLCLDPPPHHPPPVTSQPPLTTRGPCPALRSRSLQKATPLLGGHRPCEVRVALKALYSLATTSPNVLKAPKLPPTPCTLPQGARRSTTLEPLRPGTPKGRRPLARASPHPGH